MSERTLQALRDRINARLQTSAISRDRASAAGREVVAQCRQSDVETLEWVLSEIDAVLATPEPGGEGETLESRAYDIAHWIAMEARVAESLDRSVAPIESEGARRIVALASARPTPADVRERVAFEAFAWEHGRSGAAAEWIRAQWQGETPKRRAMYFDLADRILALLRTPRGEGEAAAMSANLARALAAMQAAWIEWRRGRGADAAMQWIENTLIGPGLIPGDDASDAQAFFDRAIAEIENHQIRHAAALRSDAQGEDRWEDVVFGPITEAYNEMHAARLTDRSESDVG